MQVLEQSITKLIENESYDGVLLQQIKISASSMIPTLGVFINKLGRFEMLINYDYFNSLTLDERVGVLRHEMLHLRHKHVLYNTRYHPDDRRVVNMAMDLSINQLIPTLPEGALHVSNFKKVDGTDFDRDQPFEFYFRELKKLKNQDKDSSNEDGDKTNPLDNNGQPKLSGNGEIRDKKGNLWEDSMDSHEWELSEEEKKELRNLLRRALDKHVFEYGTSVHSVEESLRELNNELSKLDHKRLVESAYRKSIPSSNRVHTWKRPSRRYGFESKGSKADESPKINTYLDTSGSISINEYNDFLGNNDKFLKFANKKCTLNFFHTSLYRSEKYKVGKTLSTDAIQSGGTDLNCVMEDIKKTNPDLAIIFTDGYYGDVSIEKVPSRVLFIISPDGTEDHPLKRFGTTVKMSK